MRPGVIGDSALQSDDKSNTQSYKQTKDHTCLRGEMEPFISSRKGFPNCNLTVFFLGYDYFNCFEEIVVKPVI